MTLLIRGGRVIDPAGGLNGNLDILIKGGVIDRVEENISPESVSESFRLLDASDAFVSPGFVDAHAHFRDPGYTEKENLHTGALAAAAGGYTSVVLMANTSPPSDTPERLSALLKRASEESIHIYSVGTATKERKGAEAADLDALSEAGAVGFSDDGSPLMDEKLVKNIMKRAAGLGKPLSLHEESPEYVGVPGVNEGRISSLLGISGAQREAEISMVKRDLDLALETGCVLDIQHVSAMESVELIRKARKRDTHGLIHAEATPNHFSLTEEAVLKYGTNAKINPPLREERDRLAIIEGLKDGTLDLIATDHAPHTEEEKGRSPFEKAPSGIIGLETAFCLALKYLVQPGILSLSALVERMSLSPSGLYGLPSGTLSPGARADLTVFSTRLSTTFGKFASRSSNSPFLGKTLPGRILFTICEGRIVYS
ncbi:MAG: dihydroorotase [Lachnospiraceae bacterium]|nr:dihydroorotase [Lachnospiraceae bacterium]